MKDVSENVIWLLSLRRKGRKEKMKRKEIFFTISIFILLTNMFVFSTPVKAPSEPKMYANPPTKTLGLRPPSGRIYTFDVMMANSTAVTTICFTLSYDPSKVNVTKITIGDALPGGSLIIADWNSTIGVITDICVTVMGICYDVDDDTVVTVTVEALDITEEAGTVINVYDMSCWDWYINEFLKGDSPYDHTLHAFRFQTNLYANPATTILGQTYPPLDKNYTFAVMLENATDVVTIAFDLYFDSSKVNITKITIGNALPGGHLLIGDWNPSSGYIEAVTVYVEEGSYNADNKTVVTVAYQTMDYTGSGGTMIDVCNMSCWDAYLNEFLSGDSPWDYTVFIRDPGIHDVSVKDIRPLETAIYAGDIVSIQVDIQNQANYEETLNITLYADLSTTIVCDEIVIGNQNAILHEFRLLTLTFHWDTLGLSPGNYTATAIAKTTLYDVDPDDDNLTKGVIQLFEIKPCPDISITCPTSITVNPSIFTYDPSYQARLINIGNVTVKSTGFEGGLRVLGSRNGTIRLCVDQPDIDYYVFFLPSYGEVQITMWLMFQPETHWGEYSGNFTLQLTICGTHRRQLLISNIDIIVCQNGAYIVNSETATFTWTLTGGSLVYLVAGTELPPGWTYSVDPEPGTFFETPHTVTVNITAPPDAREGDTGLVTLRAYKNATGTLIWQFIYFASTDNNPPTIESIETPVLSLDGSLFFNATIKDSSGIESATLHYFVNSGPWQNRTMDWASGDTFNSTQYTAQEMIGTDPKTVQYYVSAVDWFGNETQSEIQTITINTDIAITEAKASKTVVGKGCQYALNLTVSNQGTLPLDFANLAIFANSTVLETRNLEHILNGSSTTLNLLFNTSDLPMNAYVITAYFPGFPNETDTSDNSRTFVLTVTIQGDFNGDFKVGPADFALLSAAYGSTPGKPKWNPNCDINDDDKVGPFDFAKLSANYGKHYP